MRKDFVGVGVDTGTPDEYPRVVKNGFELLLGLHLGGGLHDQVVSVDLEFAHSAVPDQRVFCDK